MSMFTWPRYRAVDSTGAPISGAKLNFYAAGTSNRQDTYTTQALSVAHANPVVADANGVFAAIYLSDTLEYKIVLTDASDVTIWTEDNWDGSQAVGVSFSTRLQQIASNPLDYRSAVGDGVADEYLAVQDAIDNASRVVDLLGKTFRCDSAITMSSNLTLQNGTLDFTNCTDAEYIKIQGSVGSYTNLTANVTYLADLAAVTSASGLAAGDLVNLISAGTYCSAGQQGELCQIRDISTLDVYMTSEILDAYTTANTARLAKVTTVDNVVLKNLIITANNAVATANTRIISCYATEGLRVQNVDISGVKDYAILLAGCSDTVLEGCSFSSGAATTSTGVLLEEACQDVVIRDSVFRHMATSIDSNTTLNLSTVPLGVRRRLNIENNTFEQSETSWPEAMHIGQDSQFVRVAHNHVIGGHTGAQVNLDCADLEYIGNRIDSNGGDGVDATIMVPNNSGRGYRVAFSNNIIRGADADITWVSGAVSGGAGTLDELKITDNELDQGQVSVTAVSTGADITAITITDNVVRNMVLDGTNVTMSEALVDSNRVGGAVAALVSVNEIDRITISNNIIRGDNSTAQNGIDAPMVAGSTELRIVGNSISNVTTYGIATTDAAGTTVVHVDNNTVLLTNASTTAGITVNDAPRGSISNNIINSYGDGIYTTNTSSAFDGLVISGNQIDAGVGAGDGTGITVGATVAGNTNLTVAGNVVDLENSGASQYVLEIDGKIDNIAINGNVLVRGNDTDDNVSMTGTAASDLDGVVFGGNVLTNGAYGINISNGANVIELNNVFQSMATGNVNGTISGAIACTAEPSSNVNGVAGTGDGTGHGGVFTGGATGSAINLVSQSSDPTGAEGDIYVNSTTGLPKAHDGNVWAPMWGLLYAATSSETLTANGYYTASYTLPANTVRAGSVLKITAWGNKDSMSYSSNADDPYLELHIGGTSVALTNQITNMSGIQGWHITAHIVVQAVGASGTFACAGHGLISEGGEQAGLMYGDTLTIDTTSTIAIQVDLNGMGVGGDGVGMDGLIVEACG